MKKQLLTLCALLALGAGASDNLVVDGNFANGLKGYRYLKNGSTILHTVKDGVLTITGDEANSNSKGYVSAITKMATLTPGQKYLIEATVTANIADLTDKDAKIMIRSVRGENSTVNYLGLNQINLDTKNKRIYSAIVTIPGASERNELYIQTKNLADTDTFQVENIRVVPYKAAVAAEGELIKNGDFETILFDAWDAYRAPVRFKYAYTAPDKENGSNCLVLTGDKSKFLSSTIIQRLPKLVPGKTYMLTVNVCTGLSDAAGKKLNFSLRSATAADNRTLTYSGFDVNLRQNSWREYRVEVKVHPKSEANQLYIAADGFVPGDVVKVDDVSLVPAE
ncbi:MAG: hypothetical protein E7041_05395 [Lentisphaerae bacterium]|nr:hypothetical protein [Lentisphaerota bacterium]